MKKQPDWTWPNGKRIVAIPLSYDVNDMPSMKYGHPPRMMLDSFDEVIDIARARDNELRIIDVTSHAHIFGHHRGAHFYEKIVEQARRRPTSGSEHAPRSPIMC